MPQPFPSLRFPPLHLEGRYSDAHRLTKLKKWLLAAPSQGALWKQTQVSKNGMPCTLLNLLRKQRSTMMASKGSCKLVHMQGRYLKSVESVESGTKCQLPNYLIEVCELRNQTNEPKHSLKDALNQTESRNDESTSDKKNEKNAQKSNRDSIASSNRPQISKTTCSNLGAPQNFHELSNLQRRKSGCNVSRGADYGEPTFGIVDDPIKFNDMHRVSAANSLPDFWKSISSRVDDPLQFHDLQDGKSRSSDKTFIRREVGKSTFGNMDDSLRTGKTMALQKPWKPNAENIEEITSRKEGELALLSTGLIKVGALLFPAIERA